MKFVVPFDEDDDDEDAASPWNFPIRSSKRFTNRSNQPLLARNSPASDADNGPGCGSPSFHPPLSLESNFRAFLRIIFVSKGIFFFPMSRIQNSKAYSILTIVLLRTTFTILTQKLYATLDLIAFSSFSV